MAVTLLSNIINPQVMGDMVNAKIEQRLKLTPYAKVDTSLVGVPGDTKTVPVWGYIGDASSIGENTQIDYTAMSASAQTFTVSKAGKGITLTSEAVLSGKGGGAGSDVVAQAETQLARSIAGKVDADVLTAALGASMVYSGAANAISYNGIVEAAGKFEDEEDGIDKVLFIHPKQETQLLKDSNFLSADKFAPGVAVNGAIGKIAGCWIKKSKRVPAVDAVTAVAGKYNFKINTKATSGDKIKLGNVEIVAGGDGWSLSTDTATGNATALATTLNASTDPSVSCYTWSSSTVNLIATEDTGKEGTGAPAMVVTKTTGGTLDVTASVTTAGVAACNACYKNPIIKMEGEAANAEDELPAITIFLKKDTTVNSFYNQDYDRHEITAYKYYGVARTNDAKVVVAKFKQ